MKVTKMSVRYSSLRFLAKVLHGFLCQNSQIGEIGAGKANYKVARELIRLPG